MITLLIDHLLPQLGYPVEIGLIKITAKYAQKDIAIYFYESVEKLTLTNNLLVMKTKYRLCLKCFTNVSMINQICKNDLAKNLKSMDSSKSKSIVGDLYGLQRLSQSVLRLSQINQCLDLIELNFDQPKHDIH